MDVGLSSFVWSNYSLWTDKNGELRNGPTPRSWLSDSKPGRNFNDVLEWTKDNQWYPCLSAFE